MARQLRKVHAGNPLFTNASINRTRAIECFNAGMTAEDIARTWPEVWKLDAEGKLGQRYDYELADGSGRFETKRTITQESVREAIARHKAKQQ